MSIPQVEAGEIRWLVSITNLVRFACQITYFGPEPVLKVKHGKPHVKFLLFFAERDCVQRLPTHCTRLIDLCRLWRIGNTDISITYNKCESS